MELLNHSIDFLNYPVFVINLKSEKEKWNQTYDMLKKHGFTHIIRFDAIEYNQDKNNSENNMQDENGISTNENVIQDIWNDFGNPILKENYTLTDQAYCINHLLCLKMIIYNNIQHACITFDDIQLHENWDALSPIYWKYTPKEFDVCVLGGDFSAVENKGDNSIFYRNIYFYIVSFSGANKLINALTRQPCDVFLNIFNKEKIQVHAWIASMFKKYTEKQNDTLGGLVLHHSN
jgi:GR25 family glycosyltransferase involved in LPS biosynthesis